MKTEFQTHYDLICQKLNDNVKDEEFKKSLLSFLSIVNNTMYSESVLEKAFCFGYLTGASNQNNYDKVMDNLIDNLQNDFNNFKNFL